MLKCEQCLWNFRLFQKCHYRHRVTLTANTNSTIILFVDSIWLHIPVYKVGDISVIYALREIVGRVETESGGTRRRTGGEVKGKEANGVGSQQSSA